MEGLQYVSPLKEVGQTVLACNTRFFYILNFIITCISSVSDQCVEIEMLCIGFGVELLSMCCKVEASLDSL